MNKYYVSKYYVSSCHVCRKCFVYRFSAKTLDLNEILAQDFNLVLPSALTFEWLKHTFQQNVS